MALKGKADDNHPEEMYVSRMPKRKYAYFRDDQITFLVTHSDDPIDDKRLENFATAINDHLNKEFDGTIEKTPEVISLPRLKDEEFQQSQVLLPRNRRDRVTKALSLIRCELTGGSADPAKLIRTVGKLTKKFSRHTDDKQKTFEELTIQGTSVNWLTSVASQAGGTGGPGGRPSPYTGVRNNEEYHLDIVKQLQDKDIYGEGEGVDVAILDTAPAAHDLVSAYKEWPDHPLISRLLGPNGKLHLYPATYSELVRLTCTSLTDHDYKMTDHGLFIAGIINSIVPKAEIHLVEVLNEFGVGDFTSFVQGLIKVRQEIFKKGRLGVINCSFMFDTPLHPNHCRHLNPPSDLDAAFEQAVLKFAQSEVNTPYMLEFLYDQFFGLGKQAVAAAGNDARAGDTKRTPARYPAALKTVKGVGANPRGTFDPKKKVQPSVYSNFSESADKRGVVIRGIVTLGGEEGEGKGVLGIYLGEFPDGSQNESKWAWWAGTSFATPILAGSIASILSRSQNNITTTQGALKKLYGKGVKIIKEGRAGKQEDALPVIQGSNIL